MGHVWLINVVFKFHVKETEVKKSVKNEKMKKWVQNKAPDFFCDNFFSERTKMSSFDFWWFSVPYVPLLLRNAFYLAPTIIEQSTNEVVIKSNVDRKKAPKTAKLGYFHLKVQNKTFLSSESVSEVMFFSILHSHSKILPNAKPSLWKYRK